MSLHVMLLGPVAAVRDGSPIELGGPLPRGLVAVLALAAPQPVAPEGLLAAVWGGAAPASGRDTLRAYLSRIRSAVGAEHLERTAGGYRLAAATDVARLAVLTAEARAAEHAGDLDAARAALEAAAALWTGAPLSGVTHLPFAAEAARRLEQQRLNVGEELLALRLGSGEHADAIPYLRALLDAAPLRERLAGLLMTALYRTGRQVEALEVFTGLRARLVDELGIEPGAAVRDLHQRILRQDAALLRPDAAGAAPVAAPTGATETPVVHVPGSDPPPPATAPAAPAATPSPGAGRRPLPLPLTSFVGRTAEVTEARRLMALGRLVTLTGAGGSGKTRLALETARHEAVTAPEPPAVVELASVDDPAHVPAAVAEALGLSAVSGQPAEDLLVDVVGDRALLLLVDNCEHLVEAAAVLVQHLLERCPGLRVLATSREPLGVPGERILVVPTLSVRSDPGGEPSEAEALFVERAAHAQPGLVLDDDARRLVRRICADLDGIPLAIELAAARLHVLSLAQIADLLADRFELLTSGSRTHARHRTLEAAVAWSHDLLDDDERALFAAASAFRGGFTLDALAAVATEAPGDPAEQTGARPTGATLDVLSRLVAKSMVQVDAVGADRRYRLLQTLRDYADRQLDIGRRDVLADRHARWCAALAEEAERHLRGDGDAPWWRRLTAEQHNVRAALRHALESGQPELALRIVGALGWYWYRRGPVPEGRRWLAAALGLGDRAPRHLRAKAHLASAFLSYLAGELVPAREALLAAQAADDGSDQAVGAVTDLYLAYFEAAFGSPESARTLLALAEERAAAAPAWVRTEVLMIRGQLARAMGEPDAADALLVEGRRIAQAAGHAWGAGSCGWIAAKARLEAGRPADAAALLAETIDELAAGGDRTSTLACMHTAAAVLAALGRSEDGAVLLGAVDAVGERIGYSPLAMDPLDGERHRALVAQRLSPEAFAAAQARGRALAPDPAVRLAVTLLTGQLAALHTP